MVVVMIVLLGVLIGGCGSGDSSGGEDGIDNFKTPVFFLPPQFNTFPSKLT